MPLNALLKLLGLRVYLGHLSVSGRPPPHTLQPRVPIATQRVISMSPVAIKVV